MHRTSIYIQRYSVCMLQIRITFNRVENLYAFNLMEMESSTSTSREKIFQVYFENLLG